MKSDPLDNPGVIDPSVPNLARVYDFLLGGGHNFPADRQFAAAVAVKAPYIADAARVNRSFLRRAVLFMIDNGVRQFLDIGSGIPTVGNVHEIAHQVDPTCRVVYVDKEPIAVEHSRILLRDNARATVVQADLRDPDHLLSRPEVRELLDFSQPVGLLTLLVWHFVSDAEDPPGLMAHYRKELVSGSHVALTHITRDGASQDTNRAIDDTSRRTQDAIYPRDLAEITDLFNGFELLEPGIVGCPAWRPEGPGDFSDEPKSNKLLYAGVGNIP
ncbi:SAM-dependent methyltransferase [Actinophytocola sp.]|uniref:SAM-dependent methyltransferase n=1 Tax=Actinophytocola sp. TaxID=1872138 RepID=UPI002ED4E444